MKIVIFGLGNVYKTNKKYIPEMDEIVGYLDNNAALWGKEIDGIKVMPPTELGVLKYDKIVLMSDAADQMKKQLAELHIAPFQMIHYQEYLEPVKQEQVHFFYGEKINSIVTGNVLILVPTLGYVGGVLAAVYMGLALQKLGYEVMIAAPSGDMKFVDEMTKKGLSFAIGDSILYDCIQQKEWIMKNDYIIANTFQMLRCAITLGEYREVYVWLHESSEIYQKTHFWLVDWINNHIKSDFIQNLHIYAVSEVAKVFFEKHVNLLCEGVFEYGIPDERDEISTRETGLVTIGLIGGLIPNKGQSLLLDAFEKMDESKREKCKIILIGAENQTSYCREIMNRIKTISNVTYVGEKTREEMRKYFGELVAFVVASKEETMSIVATEALMCGRLCIVPNTIGMAKYIRPYKNGLIYECCNSDELCRQLEWCVDNPEALEEIEICARDTFENYFSLEVLQERLKTWGI